MLDWIDPQFFWMGAVVLMVTIIGLIINRKRKPPTDQ
jgi:hypothetical protein